MLMIKAVWWLGVILSVIGAIGLLGTLTGILLRFLFPIRGLYSAIILVVGIILAYLGKREGG
jgi:hypothetical protein